MNKTVDFSVLDKPAVTADDIAAATGLGRRTVLERIAPKPDFPNRISLSKKTFWWKGEEVKRYFERQRERRPK